MKLHITYDLGITCKVIMQEQLELLAINYSITGLGEVEIKETISSATFLELKIALKKYGIEIIDDKRNIFIQKIKDVIMELVYLEDKLPNSKISAYIADKLNHSYGYLSNVFSEVTYTSVENYIIIQKIERVKQLIIADNLTLTEVAWQLNYSSVAHLSSQFKKITGLTPTAFQRIIKRRRSEVSQIE